jgi:uncharacterized protein YbjT (DUF2867 family)
MSKKILVIGATGNLGKPTAESLKEAGYDVRVLTRNGKKASELFDSSYEIVVGDAGQSESVMRAMDGCHGVHISIGGLEELMAVRTVVDNAELEEIKQITYISGSTVSRENAWFPMVKSKLRAEEILTECPVPHTIFRPTWPFEMLEKFVQGDKAFIMGSQKLPLHPFSVKDLGRMVAKSYSEKKAQDKVFYIHGSEVMTLRDALMEYCSVALGGKVKVSSMSVALTKIIGTLSGNKELKKAAQLMGYFNRTREMGDPLEANTILGAPSITFSQWLETVKK